MKTYFANVFRSDSQILSLCAVHGEKLTWNAWKGPQTHQIRMRNRFENREHFAGLRTHCNELKLHGSSSTISMSKHVRSYLVALICRSRRQVTRDVTTCAAIPYIDLIDVRHVQAADRSALNCACVDPKYKMQCDCSSSVVCRIRNHTTTTTTTTTYGDGGSAATKRRCISNSHVRPTNCFVEKFLSKDMVTVEMPSASVSNRSSFWMENCDSASGWRWMCFSYSMNRVPAVLAPHQNQSILSAPRSGWPKTVQFSIFQLITASTAAALHCSAETYDEGEWKNNHQITASNNPAMHVHLCIQLLHGIERG